MVSFETLIPKNLDFLGPSGIKRTQLWDHLIILEISFCFNTNCRKNRVYYRLNSSIFTNFSFDRYTTVLFKNTETLIYEFQRSPKFDTPSVKEFVFLRQLTTTSYAGSELDLVKLSSLFRQGSTSSWSVRETFRLKAPTEGVELISIVVTRTLNFQLHFPATGNIKELLEPCFIPFCAIRLRYKLHFVAKHPRKGVQIGGTCTLARLYKRYRY